MVNKLAPRPANVKPVRGAKLNKNHPLARGLVGIWLLNEGTGNTLFDHTGNGYNASLSGFGDLPSWGLALNSPIGIDYTGNSQESWQYEITGLSDYLNDKSECTIFVAGLGYNLYETALIVGAQGGFLGDIIIEEWYDGFCYFACHDTVGSSNYPYYDQNDGYLGSSIKYFPHMNVLVYNGNLSGTNRIKGYINAIERSLNNLNTPPATLNLADSDALFCIGGFYNDVFVTRGHIVYAGVYERALTAEEIKELYINPYEMFYPI